ncbi:hypothetical protein NESM_000650600 [Novymonas esmeraldas]|uniref:Membrane-associated protein n=1 Tax=Novymonas esmeraldas TaxID=1808958 RepID=A0AAW0ES62_9TRYP
MGSNTPIIIGCVVGVACVIGLVVGIICCIQHLRRALRVPQPPVYAVAESVALHEESEFGAAVRSQHSAATAPSPDAGRNGLRSAQDRRDNYADRNAVDYRAEATGRYVELDGGVRPASPNAERVDGVPIEARVRPRRNLPRGRVVVTNGDQDVCLDFSGVERVPQAGPPPLTHEEKQRLEDERNRVASPEYYGHAEYEFRRASNRSSPNVLLSSSLLHELQRQYGAASASGHAFTPFAGDGSVRSMSFRPGSPAGSARRARHGQQSATPNSASLGNGSVGGLPFLRRRKTPSGRNGAGDGATPKQRRQPRSTSSAPRHHNDDLESTSDDFEDVSLPNASFNARREQLREFLLRQQDHQHTRGRFSPTTGIEYANGFDHVSLRGTSPVFPDRQTSAAAAGGHIDRGGSAMAGSAVSPLDQSAPSYPLQLPQPTTTQGLPPLGGSFQSYPSGPSTTVNTPLVALNGVPPFPQIQLPPANHSATAAALHSTPAASVAAAQAREAGKPPRTPLSTATRHVDVPVAPPPNRHSSGLRSPFSLPGNDPVTASDSPSSGEARTHRSAHVSPLQRPGGGVDLRLRHPHTDPNGAGGNQRTAVKNGRTD